jgi:hypothetical protein
VHVNGIRIGRVPKNHNCTDKKERDEKKPIPNSCYLPYSISKAQRLGLSFFFEERYKNQKNTFIYV